MKRCTIIKYKFFEHANIYTIQFEEKSINETDDFISRFLNYPKYSRDFQIIIQYIQKIGETGVLERYFRPEKRAKAIPIHHSKLRLYCCRVSDRILVLGNGGIKTSKKAQDSPDCYFHFYLMNELEKSLKNSIRKNKTYIKDHKLTGQLTFELKSPEQ